MVSIPYHVVVIPFASQKEERNLGMKVIQNVKIVVMMVLLSFVLKKTQSSWQSFYTVVGITSRPLSQV